MATQRDPAKASYALLLISLSVLPMKILSQRFLFCVTSHLLIENAFTAPRCTQEQSCVLDTNVQKPWSAALLGAGEALEMRKASLAPRQTPG